jgi:hypothetical protein
MALILAEIAAWGHLNKGDESCYAGIPRDIGTEKDFILHVNTKSKAQGVRCEMKNVLEWMAVYHMYCWILEQGETNPNMKLKVPLWKDGDYSYFYEGEIGYYDIPSYHRRRIFVPNRCGYILEISGNTSKHGKYLPIHPCRDYNICLRNGSFETPKELPEEIRNKIWYKLFSEQNVKSIIINFVETGSSNEVVTLFTKVLADIPKEDSGC